MAQHLGFAFTLLAVVGLGIQLCGEGLHYSKAPAIHLECRGVLLTDESEFECKPSEMSNLFAFPRRSLK